MHEGGRSTPAADAPAPTDDVPEALSEAGIALVDQYGAVRVIENAFGTA